MQAITAPDHFVAAIAWVGTLFTIAASLWLRGTVKSFIRKTSSALERISEGNFSFSVDEDSRDQFGFILNEIESMRMNLRTIIADLTSATVQIGSVHMDNSIASNEIYTLASCNAEGVRKTKEVTAELAQTASELDLLVKHFEKSL